MGKDLQLLHALVKETYLTDIIGRNKVKNDAELSDLFNILASNIGTLTNPTKLSNTLTNDAIPAYQLNNGVYVMNVCDYLLENFGE